MTATTDRPPAPPAVPRARERAAHWCRSHRADPRALPLADRHYTRQKPGTPQFVPPGRCLVLLTPDADALWVTAWPFAEYVKHEWAGAWVCSLFRNEGPALSSALIREAVAITRYHFGGPPALGMVTFVDASKVRHKRDQGRCYRRAGFTPWGHTKGGLLVLGLTPGDMPEATPPLGEFDTRGRAAREGGRGLMEREATRAAIGRLRARTLAYGEVEDALWALAEREGLHEYLPDDPEPQPCGCAICRLVVPLMHELAGRERERTI